MALANQDVWNNDQYRELVRKIEEYGRKPSDIPTEIKNHYHRFENIFVSNMKQSSLTDVTVRHLGSRVEGVAIANSDYDCAFTVDMTKLVYAEKSGYQGYAILKTKCNRQGGILPNRMGSVIDPHIWMDLVHRWADSAAKQAEEVGDFGELGGFIVNNNGNSPSVHLKIRTKNCYFEHFDLVVEFQIKDEIFVAKNVRHDCTKATQDLIDPDLTWRRSTAYTEMQEISKYMGDDAKMVLRAIKHFFYRNVIVDDFIGSYQLKAAFIRYHHQFQQYNQDRQKWLGVEKARRFIEAMKFIADLAKEGKLAPPFNAEVNLYSSTFGYTTDRLNKVARAIYRWITHPDELIQSFETELTRATPKQV